MNENPPSKKESEETIYGDQIVYQVYPDDYLSDVCNKIGVKKDDERARFFRGIRHVGARYIDLKKANQNRITPTKQNKLFSQYSSALREAHLKFKEIQASTVASAKLGKAVRKQYEQVSDTAMKDMFYPYYDSQGMAVSIFESFLSILADAAADAESQDVGNDKAEISSQLLTGWVTGIGKMWPKDAATAYALGKRDDELNIYTSVSLGILHELVSKIDPDVSTKNIENAMRTVKQEDLLEQPLAIFFLA